MKHERESILLFLESLKGSGFSIQADKHLAEYFKKGSPGYQLEEEPPDEFIRGVIYWVKWCFNTTEMTDYLGDILYDYLANPIGIRDSIYGTLKK